MVLRFNSTVSPTLIFEGLTFALVPLSVGLLFFFSSGVGDMYVKFGGYLNSGGILLCFVIGKGVLVIQGVMITGIGKGVFLISGYA